MKRFINFLAGFLTGLAVGGVIAALFAPQSGGETLDALRGRAERIMDDARQAAEATRRDAQIRLAELKAEKEG
jgi:gas vesicle protein